jgi:hypothetical protein
MKPLFIILSLFIIDLSLTKLYAQDDDYSRDIQKSVTKKKQDDKKDNDEPGKRVLWGGTAGVQLGDPTYIELSPKVGYQLTSKIMLGGGITYIYYKENLGDKGSFYGGDIYGKYKIISGIFTHLEYEALNFEYIDYSNNLQGESKRSWVGSLFVGVGFRQPIGENGFIEVMLLYDLNYHDLSPHSSPWVPRINIFF